MKVHQMLICIFILSLQDGNTGLINAETIITGKEGGDITHGCYFLVSGGRKIFCKEGCEEKDILVETTGDRAQRGRYSIGYKQIGRLYSVLYVSITNLTKSDSGRYTCRMDGGYLSNEDFEIRVEDALQDGNTGLINAQTITGKEGGNITYECYFFDSGSRKIFCKEGCEEKEILVETTDDRAQRGRYSIGWKKGRVFSFLYVSITNLTKSDSGRYRCRLDGGYLSNKEFEIRVEDVPSTSTPTTTQSLNVPSAAATGVPLYVRLTLVVIFIVSSAAVLIFCRRRASKAEDPPVEAELVNVTEADPVYDELREDRRSRSPPVEISTVHYLPCSQFAEDSV